VLSGYNENFAWGVLGLGAGETLSLLDDGTLGGALYVGTLDLPGGLSQLTSNGLNIYYDANAAGNAWLQRGTFALAGGGFATPVPEPAGLILLATGSALLLRRRRC
jgi:hypothetical protein